MIAAIVVLFHPDREAVERLLSCLAGQVAAVYAIDNTPGPPSLNRTMFDDYAKNVTYVSLGDNKGIAEAQNIGIELSIRKGCSHVLLLDQDSAPCLGMVRNLLIAEEELLKIDIKVAALAPQVIDGRSGRRACACIYRWPGFRLTYRDTNSTVPVPTDTLIASGSLIRTSVLQIVGLMRTDLFIEHVDTEWALRARSAGYQSYCAPNALLTHVFGDAFTKMFGKNIYMYSDSRYYYKVRNEVYLARLKTMGWHWRAYIVSILPYHLMLYTALSKNKIGLMRLLARAIWDGATGRLGSLDARAIRLQGTST